VVLVDSLAAEENGTELVVLAVPKMLVLAGLSVVLELSPKENEGLAGSLVEEEEEALLVVAAGADRLARKVNGEAAAAIVAGFPKPERKRSVKKQ